MLAQLIINISRYLFVCLGLFFLSESIAQVSDSTLWNNQREATYWLDGDTLELDSMSIFPNSVFIEGWTDSLYHIENNQLVLSQPIRDSIKIRYRVMPQNLQIPEQRRDRRLLANIDPNTNNPLYNGNDIIYNPFDRGNTGMGTGLDFEGLTYEGTFARGVSVGNRQDLVLNSSFNMQVRGKVGEVEILGAITDNQVPIQPEGNTQQINDFDRLFIQFSIHNNRLLAGDYDLSRPEYSYFTNYQRRLQGADLETNWNLGENWDAKIGGSFAFSRGKFARNSFLGEEGNQGPYRLNGNNGEQFIIILAGTERVFIDDVLMQRGEDADYVINYNQGEISFTNRQLITKDKRIVVEFSYTDLNFVRTLYTAKAEAKSDKGEFHVYFYSEQDAGNQPAQESLSDEARDVLMTIGDDLDNAFISGARPVDDSTGAVRYRNIDTLVNGITYTDVYIYEPVLDLGEFEVRFTAIPTGGNYIRTLANTNGTVYEWVAPDTLGNPTGTHEPIQVLVAPEQQQLLEIGGTYRVGKGGALEVRGAMSSNDLNTFSDVDNNDNIGLATRLGYTQVLKIGGKEIVDTTGRIWVDTTIITLKGFYEYVNARFEFVEPYRNREFTRDWSINTSQNVKEHWLGASAAWRHPQWGTVFYESSALLRDTLYNGIKQSANLDLIRGGFRSKGRFSWVSARTNAAQTSFVRPNLDLSYTFKSLNNLKIGVYGEQELNTQRNIAADTVQANSFYYNVVRFYTEFPASEHLDLKLRLTRRYDYAPRPDGFDVGTVADEVGFDGSWVPPRSRKPKKGGTAPKNKRSSINSRLGWSFQYRNLRILDTTFTDLDPKETYLGRLEYRLNAWQGILNWTTSYELGSGQQQRIEYRYVEVDEGQGTYTWIDRNDDGIEQLGEFEIANFVDQANYIRVTVLTGDFIRSNNVLFNQSLNIDFRSLGRRNREKKSLKFLSRWSTRSNIQIERKTLQSSDILAFNPFQLDVADTALVSAKINWQSALFFNRSNPKFSSDFSYRDDRSRIFLTGGFDTRERQEYAFFARWTIGKKWSGQFKTNLGNRLNTSEFFPERDYTLNYYEILPEWSYTSKNRLFRTTFKYSYKFYQNQQGLEEQSISHNLGTEIKYTPKKTNLTASFSWVNLAFDGQPNTPVSFVMTEGLQDGQNFLWSINFSRFVSKDNRIQLFFSYEGRKTGDAPVVHVGRAQLRASF